MHPAIKVTNLAKKYCIGGQETGYRTFREAILEAVFAPLKRLTGSAALRDEGSDFWALQDVSFEIQPGEVVGIIGRNGAGKSTLLKVLSKITEPTSGRVEVRGRVGSLLEVGTGFHPELTGRENIYMNGSILGMRKAEIDRKFDEIVHFSEVEKFLDTPVKRYSSGMYVRLAFAVAANLEPEILIVDEVLAVGDAQFQKKCLAKMQDVGSQGRSVLFVSHNLTAVRAMCNRAILLQQGKVNADGDTADVIHKYTAEANNDVLQREWSDEMHAPQNQSAIITKIRVYSKVSKATAIIDTDTEFYIEITFKTKSDKSVVGFTIIFYDEENNCVFSTINNHEIRWYGKQMPLGVYTSTCHIPAGLLNNRIFNVSLNIFGNNFADIVTITDVLRIEVHDGTFVRGDYHGTWSGFIRPLLEWDTQEITRN